MSLDNQYIIRGNLVPEGIVAPNNTTWPSSPHDGQLFWKLPEQSMFVYDESSVSWIPVGEEKRSLARVYEDHSNIWGVSFAQLRAGEFFYRWRNKAIVRSLSGHTDYDFLWKYVYWMFSLPSTPGVWTAPVKYATPDDLYDFLEGYVSSVGGVFQEIVFFRTFESVDTSDPYPVKVHHRNSLVASIRGGGQWVRHSFPLSGVSGSFNAPSYYLNFYGQVGQRFVQAVHGVLPATNNDGVVWHRRGNKTMWRWPRVGNAVHVSSPGSKGAAWDTVTNSYVTPAPVGSYTIQAPFFLHEQTSRLLSVTMFPRSGIRWAELFYPMALVFPVVLGARYYGYVVVPHGSDSLFTETLDTGVYDFIICCKYRGTNTKVYIGPILPGSSDDKSSLFSLRQLPFLSKTGRSQPPDPGYDVVPVSVDIARRNRITGERSKWFNAYRVARKVRHSTFKIEPAPWIR